MSVLMRTGRAVIRGSSCLLLLVGLSAPGWAFDEIIVSARKVEESLQDVPLAITALSAEQLEKSGIQDLTDIANVTPGLNFFSPIGEFLPTPIIRGVAQTDIFGETNVGSYVDGVYVAGRAGLNFRFLDLERVEVVKGPQSALYGRNSFSGSINYVTKAAPDTFEFKVDGTAGSDDRLAGKITIGGPILGDSLKGYVSAGYDDFDGTYDDNIGGNDVGGRKFKTYFGKLEWDATDAIDVVGTWYYSDDAIDISSHTSLPMNCENIANPNSVPAPRSPRYAAYCGEIPSLNEQNNMLAAAGYPLQSGSNTNNKIKGPLGEDRDIYRGSLNIDWDIGVGTITALTGYNKTKQSAVDDGTRNLGNMQPFEYCPSTAPNCFNFANVQNLPSGLLQPNAQDKVEEWSQEVRFTSPQEDAFRYGVGGYYFNVKDDGGDSGLIATAPLPADFGEFGPFLGGGFPIGDEAFLPWFDANGDLDTDIDTEKSKIESWAGFGWTELDFAEKFTARAELRYTYQEEKITLTRINVDPAFNPPENTTVVKGDDDWDFWTGRLSLKYQVSDDWMVYGQVANGIKSGTLEPFNEPTEAAPNAPVCQGDNRTEFNQLCTVVPVGQEKNTTYEVGSKGEALDGRMQLAMSLFYIDWSDAAVRGTFERDPETGVALEQPEAVTEIAGSVDVWGWDLQGSFAPDEFWLFTFGLSYQDAQWDNAQLQSLIRFPSFGDENCFVDLGAGETVPNYCGRIDGQQVARQPPWQGNFGMQYTTPVKLSTFNENWEVFGRADFTYEDDWYPQDDNLARIPDHTYTNVRLGLQSERYAVELWVKNLFQEDDASASFRDVFFGNNDNIYYDRPPGSDQNQFFPYRYTVSYPQLRTWGVTVRARFGGE